MTSQCTGDKWYSARTGCTPVVIYYEQSYMYLPNSWIFVPFKILKDCKNKIRENVKISYE